MRRVFFTVAAATLSWLALAPSVAQASWLSEALHAWLDRDDYGYYAYPPAVEYYPGGYGEVYAPGYTVVPGYYYYGGPYYRYVPYRAWYGPRHEWHDWDHWRHEHHEHRR